MYYPDLTPPTEREKETLTTLDERPSVLGNPIPESTPQEEFEYASYEEMMAISKRLIEKNREAYLELAK